MAEYRYCLVKIDSERSLWYRTNDDYYDVGMEVIVPLHRWGRYSLEVGEIAEVHFFDANNVPYPLRKTKGIYGIADENKKAIIEVFNQAYAENKIGLIDISWGRFEHEYGRTAYLTREPERKIQRRIFENDPTCIVTEDFPSISDEDQKYNVRVHLGLEKPVPVYHYDDDDDF